MSRPYATAFQAAGRHSASDRVLQNTVLAQLGNKSVYVSVKAQSLGSPLYTR